MNAAARNGTTNLWRPLVATLTLIGALLAPLWSAPSALAQTSGGIDIATSVSPDPVTPGGTATVTIDVTNNSGQTLGVIDVRLSNDDGFAFTATAQGSPCIAFPTNTACELATVADGDTRTIVVEVDVASTAPTGLLGELDVAAQSLTPSGFNGSASQAINVEGRIDIVTSVAPDPAQPGDTAVVTIDVTNNTGQTLGVIDVRLSNDDGFAFTASYQGSSCAVFPDNVACELATVAGGDTRTIVVEVDVASTAPTGLLGELDVAAQSLTPSGFTASASQAINVQRLLQISASVAPDPTPVGETALVTVTVTNDTGEDLDVLRADISAPDGTVFTATVGGSPCADFTTFLTCTRAPAAPGETLVFEVQVPIPTDASSGPFTELTIVATPVQNGDNGPTVEATVPIEAVIPAPVLTLAHTVTPEVVTQGGQTTHTIVVTNTGNATATDVVVALPHPTGVDHSSSTTTAGTHEVPERQWTIPTLPPGETHTIEIVRTHTTTVAPGAVEHQATVTATGPSGAHPPVDAHVTVTVTAPALPETGNSTTLAVLAALMLMLGIAALWASRTGVGRRRARLA